MDPNQLGIDFDAAEKKERRVLEKLDALRQTYRALVPRLQSEWRRAMMEILSTDELRLIWGLYLDNKKLLEIAEATNHACRAIEHRLFTIAKAIFRSSRRPQVETDDRTEVL